MTRAADLAGVARRTFYNHISRKRISLVKDEDGSVKVHLSELERVYGIEVIARNLKALADAEEGATSDDVHVRAPAHADGRGGAGPGTHEVLALKERIRSLEEQRAQLESHQRREREQSQEEIDHLRESLKRAQDHHAQITALLTHQSQDYAGKEADHKRKRVELGTAVRNLKKMNDQVLRELKAERSKPFWRRVFP